MAAFQAHWLEIKERQHETGGICKHPSLKSNMPSLMLIQLHQVICTKSDWMVFVNGPQSHLRFEIGGVYEQPIVLIQTGGIQKPSNFGLIRMYQTICIKVWLVFLNTLSVISRLDTGSFCESPSVSNQTWGVPKCPHSHLRFETGYVKQGVIRPCIHFIVLSSRCNFSFLTPFKLLFFRKLWP